MLHLAPYGLNWSVDTSDEAAVIIPADFITKLSTAKYARNKYTVNRSDGTSHVYKRGAHLGSGSFGNVYECTMDGSSNYIVKEMKYDDEREFINTLLETIVQIIVVKETEKSEYPEFKIKGPFAPRVFDFAYDESTGQAFIFAEKMYKTVRNLIDGWSINRRKPGSKKKSGKGFAAILLKISIVLSELYNRLAFNHRDFKSDNCMYMRSDDGTFVPRIIDFGFSCIKYNKLTISTVARRFKHCSIGGRDLTQFIFECVNYYPDMVDTFKPVANALLTFKRGNKVCNLLKKECGFNSWRGSYDFVNTKSGENPNAHPGVVRNVCEEFLSGGDWRTKLIYGKTSAEVPVVVPVAVPVARVPVAVPVARVPVVARHINSRICPSAKPNYNPKTKRCVKACPDGKSRNSSFKCVKRVLAPVVEKICPSAKPNYNPKTKRCIKACPTGQKRNSSFKCKRISTRNTGVPEVRIVCPLAKPNYNPKTKRCIKACPNGQKRNSTFKCKRSTGVPVLCPPAKPDYNPKTKRCVKSCPIGKKRDADFLCVKV